MKLSRDALTVGRVVHEDENFLTIEFGKHDDVKWTVAPLPGDETRQQFFTVVFVHKVGDHMEVWKPWEAE